MCERRLQQRRFGRRGTQTLKRLVHNVTAMFVRDFSKYSFTFKTIAGYV